MSKPNVIILGGTGFIGRNLVQYLVENNLCAKIRAVDKVLPQTAFLGKGHAAAFENPIVEFKQGNLTNVSSIEKMFTLEGEEKFSICFNLAAETKYSQTEEVYKEKILDVAKKCAAQAVKSGCTKWVEVSTAQVYEAGKKPSPETDKTKPWTLQAKYKLEAEAAVKAESGLKVWIVRPAIVYGPGDSTGVAPRLICGAVYKHLGEKMKFLWSKDLKMHTVHVHDVCKALWYVVNSTPAGEIYNLADKSDTDQGSINTIAVEPIFKIETGFHGGVASTLATKAMNMQSIAEDANDKHLKPWSELCKRDGIVNTPLTPYIDQELLYNNGLSVDGSKIEKAGFTYDHPTMTEALVREEIQYFVDQNLFPKI